MLIGKRLILRPAVPDDAPLMAEWISDPAFIGEHANVWPVTRPMQERHIADTMASFDRGLYLIIDREHQEPTGTIGFLNAFPNMYAEPHRIVEIWYHVHPNFRRQGIATQAVRLLVNHLFDATPTERIQAFIVVGNEASCRVADAAGMQREGICRNLSFVHGRYVDTHLYALVRGDWQDEQAYRKAGPEF